MIKVRITLMQALTREGRDPPSQQLDLETAWAVGFMPGLTEEEEGLLPPGSDERLYIEVSSYFISNMREHPLLMVPSHLNVQAPACMLRNPPPLWCSHLIPDMCDCRHADPESAADAVARGRLKVGANMSISSTGYGFHPAHIPFTVHVGTGRVCRPALPIIALNLSHVSQVAGQGAGTVSCAAKHEGVCPGGLDLPEQRRLHQLWRCA